ncbi:MAG: Gamma-glutamyltranspeptidase [Xanthomonadales bacterium]|nr:gamma-glutamyltransferase [Gammaproteobacteria bacterium]MBT8052841.1 gamma-glutamyltransferase [Gammaproteobacteria bacterium]NND55698.1 Gamma-glutamyltranspeptidase [Xanthomonadales bacterium]NNK50009.1 Gamma-glutamyltranspeptidase [Xanthomonadales bacterium]
MAKRLGVAASGSAEVSQTAVEILKAGGNAFDAVLGALCTASIAEPLLVSLGGGGFLLGLPEGGKPTVFDFFCQTPERRRADPELDFYPIVADFGTATQEFHIGMGSIAVPGVVAGIFEAHRALGRMPIGEIVTPAIELARSGVTIDAFHHYILRILRPIMEATPESFALYRSPANACDLISEGELLCNPEAADALEALIAEGPDLFYRGEWAARLAADSRDGGGHLTLEDLAHYRVEQREPVVFRHRGARCAINPPPSPGGSLVAFALGVMADWEPAGDDWGSTDHVLNVLRGMRAASVARHEYSMEAGLEFHKMRELLGEETIRQWQKGLRLHSLFSRGTTHISVADAQGNIASLTASNGEGCSYLLPGTGIMLNNMLGEEDLNPGGFNRWKKGVRLASMMSPAVVEKPDGTRFALGSGGSNRIRSAITQVLVNLLDYQMTPEQAVAAPRFHLEGDMLSIEPGFDSAAFEAMESSAPCTHTWPEKNLFFGGVHTVSVKHGGIFDGAGDPRRGGAVAYA